MSNFNDFFPPEAIGVEVPSDDTSIVAGDAVVMNRLGKAVAVKGTAGQTVLAGTVLNFDNVQDSNSFLGLARIGVNGNAYAIARHNTTTNVMELVIFTTDGNVTPTEGSSFTIPSATEGASFAMQLCWNEASQKMFLLMEQGSNTAVVYSITFDGSNVPTFSAKITAVSSGFSTSDAAMKCVSRDDQSCVIVYVDSTATDTRVLAIDMSGSDPDVGVFVIISSNGGIGNAICWDELHQQVLVAHTEGSGAQDTAIAVLGGEGIEIRLFDIVIIDALNPVSFMGLACFNGRWALTVTTITLFTGTTVPGSIGYDVNSGKDNTTLDSFADHILIIDPKTEKVMFVYNNTGTSGEGFFRLGDFADNGVIVWGTSTFFLADDNSVNISDSDFINGRLAVAILNEAAAATSDQETFMLRPDGDVSENSRKFAGLFASSDQAAGVVKVIGPNQISSDQSGLTAGVTLYIDFDGTLTTDPLRGPEAGLALNATQLLIASQDGIPIQSENL